MAGRLLPWLLGVSGLCACGAAAGAGGGADNLPTRAAGPYGKLEDDPETPVREPVVLSDPDEQVSFRAPSAVASGAGRFTVYFAAEPVRPIPGPTEIWVARGLSLTEGPETVTPVLAAKRAWEATRVDHPQLIVPGLDAPMGLLYEAGAGVIGYAESEDGVSFARVGEGPLLVSEGPEEGDRVGAPAAVWVSETRLLVYYEVGPRDPSAGLASGGAIHAVALDRNDAAPPGDPARWTRTRLDGDPRSAERDPVLGPDPFLGTFDEGAVGCPWIGVTRFAERPVFDLFYCGRDAGGEETVGFAGSHDGRFFQRFDKNPVLPAGGATERDPSVVRLGTRAVMFYTEVRSARPQAIGAAIYP